MFTADKVSERARVARKEESASLPAPRTFLGSPRERAMRTALRRGA
jgi:hypothetical protein